VRAGAVKNQAKSEVRDIETTAPREFEFDFFLNPQVPSNPSDITRFFH